MKIDPHDPGSARPVSGSRQPVRSGHRAPSKGSAGSAAAASGLSERVKLAQAATAAMADLKTAGERLVRITELQTAIDSGQYSVPADELVNRLWQSGAIRW